MAQKKEKRYQKQPTRIDDTNTKIIKTTCVLSAVWVRPTYVCNCQRPQTSGCMMCTHALKECVDASFITSRSGDGPPAWTCSSQSSNSHPPHTSPLPESCSEGRINQLRLIQFLTVLKKHFE